MRTILFIVLLSFACVSTHAQDNPYPSAAEISQAKAGELVVKPGTYQGQNADWCMLALPENRDKPEGKLIHLPILRIYAKNKTGMPPVFYFFGGPGATNIHTWWPESFYADHDFVQVGYRGVDGPVKLDIQEIGKAMQGGSPFDPGMLRKAGEALTAGFARLRKEGIDPDCYTMMDVVDDLEAARKALGYGKINLISHSYGTQIASLYCMRYPGSIGRNLMVGASAPGFATVWEPAEVDRVIRMYAELWKQDPKCAARTSDLEETIRLALAGLPREWKNIRIDPDKVKLAAFKMLYDTGTAAQALDAFVSAQEGDWGGLALLSLSWDKNPTGGLSVGDTFCKLLSAGIYQTGRDYLREMDPPGSIIGSPLTRLSMGMVQLNPRLPGSFRQIPEKYRKQWSYTVPTLVVNGALDISSPVTVARKELMPHLRDGKLTVLPNMGHNDPFTQQNAFVHLMDTFYRTGEADASMYTRTPVNFTPAQRLTDIAKEMLK
ncbi:MAG: alpha/beta hydrolase [Candidatus Latescibacterota bacterium]